MTNKPFVILYRNTFNPICCIRVTLMIKAPIVVYDLVCFVWDIIVTGNTNYFNTYNTRRQTYHDQIQDVPKKGQVQDLYRRAPKKAMKRVDEMKNVCRDYSKWKALVSVYPDRKHEYICTTIL